MLIDWTTVAAQIVNFVVLLALLKWLLFDRVVRAMDQREEKIASRLDEAARKEEEAYQKAESLEEDRRELESGRRKMLQEAKQQADKKRRELLQQAREEVDQVQDEWQRDLEQQREQFIAELSERAGEALQAALREALKDLADADVQQATARVFLERLERMDGDKRARLGEAVEAADGQIVVASASELPDSLREEITSALKRHFRDDAEIVFETSPELISGLEIRSHGHALAWNLRGYLDQFGETLKRTLHEEIQATH